MTPNDSLQSGSVGSPPSYNSGGRPYTVKSTPLGGAQTTYVSSASYATHGALSQIAMGSGITETTGFNARLQPVSIQAGNLLTLGYTYSPTQNNGNVQSQTITRPGVGSWTQTYGYDGVNRLGSANESGTGSWSENYGYDLVGNRWVASRSGLPTLTNETPQGQNWYLPNNQIGGQISGWTYDAAGNLTAIGGVSRGYTYDAENRMIIATVNGSTANYSYDGDGRRVQKVTPSGTTTYVYDAAGQLAAEYSTVANTTSGPEYVTADHLGSTRLVTDGYGVVKKCFDYVPYGEEIPNGYGGRTASCFGPMATYPASPDILTQKFTSKERDAETGLDYFGARYFSGAQGRFTSSDPLMASARVSNPQTWNRYSYGLSNPLRFTDPTGMYTCEGTKDQCGQFEKSRTAVLKSKDSDAVRAANAYGTAKDNNGVIVRFADSIQNDRGGKVSGIDGGIRVDPNDPSRTHLQVSLLVTIQSDNVSNQETIAHEGSHVADHQAFVNSLSMSNPFGDQSLNITGLATETRAYELSVRYTLSGNGRLNYGACGGPLEECKFGPGMAPVERDQKIHNLITDPRNKYTGLDKALYPELVKPQQK